MGALHKLTDLQELSNNFKPLFTNVYDVTFTNEDESPEGGGINSIATFHAKSVTIPEDKLSLRFNEANKTVSISNEQHPYKRGTNLSITWRENQELEVKKFHMDWIGLIYDRYSDTYKSIPTGDAGKSTRNKLRKEVVVKVYTSDSNSYIKYTFHNVFPTNIGATQLSWSKTSDVLSYTMSYIFEYWTVEIIKGGNVVTTERLPGFSSDQKNIGTGVDNIGHKDEPVPKIKEVEETIPQPTLDPKTEEDRSDNDAVSTENNRVESEVLPSIGTNLENMSTYASEGNTSAASSSYAAAEVGEQEVRTVLESAGETKSDAAETLAKLISDRGEITQNLGFLLDNVKIIGSQNGVSESLSLNKEDGTISLVSRAGGYPISSKTLTIDDINKLVEDDRIVPTNKRYSYAISTVLEQVSKMYDLTDDIAAYSGNESGNSNGLWDQVVHGKPKYDEGTILGDAYRNEQTAQANYDTATQITGDKLKAAWWYLSDLSPTIGGDFNVWKAKNYVTNVGYLIESNDTETQQSLIDLALSKGWNGTDTEFV